MRPVVWDSAYTVGPYALTAACTSPEAAQIVGIIMVSVNLPSLMSSKKAQVSALEDAMVMRVGSRCLEARGLCKIP